MTILKPVNLSDSQKKNLAAGGVSAAGIAAYGLAASPAHATGGTASSSISQMQTDITAVDGLVDVVQPLAVGAIVFMIAAILVKRFAFA